jgi:hypothetical protein
VNGSNDTKHIKNYRRYMCSTTYSNTHKPNNQTRRLPSQKTPKAMEKKNYQHTTLSEKPSKLPPKILTGEPTH